MHIIRDGRDVARSLVAQSWGPESVSAGAREWRSAVEAGRAAAPELGDRLIEVRYEELHASPRPGIERVYSHLGLEGSIDAAVAAAGEVENLGGHDKRVGAAKWRETWGKRELGEFDRVAGDLVRELGY